MRDYNNELELVLENKNFSSDIKSFLLSMLYKIETSYNDYMKVKNISKETGEFITQIIEIIRDNCDKIELIRPLDDGYEKLLNSREKCIVNKKEKSIVSLYNEQTLLYAILKLKNDYYEIDNELMLAPLGELLSKGESIGEKEVIRDFDGWTWNVDPNQIENIEYNLVFQNILMLVGYNFYAEYQIKDNLAKVYEKKEAKNVYVLIAKIALLMYLKNHKEKLEWYKTKRIELAKEVKQMEDKISYVKEITEQRKQLEKRVKTIDKCLTDGNTLKREFVKANQGLDEDKKIFSTSDFVDIIQKEKNDIIQKIKKYNKMMLPINYIVQKSQTEETLKILEVLEESNDIYYYILELQKVFIKGLKEKLEQAQTRKEIMDLIYNIRYYKNVPYKDKKIRDVEELQKRMNKLEETLYDVACKMNVMNAISVNSQVNNEMVQTILNTNIIELENIELLFEAKDYRIVLTIYDEENIERTLEYDTIEGLVSRMDKKFRMFIK